MEYRFLGRTGLKVSELCLGAMLFGSSADEKESHQILDRFVDAGGTFIDTADAYGGGVSEEVLGRWLRGRTRDDLVIATKAYVRTGSGPNDIGAGRKHLMSAVDASLRRLGTDYIDLYQVHVYDRRTPVEETMSTLDRLVTSGKVRFVGCSNHPAWRLQKAIDVAVQHGWEPYVCLQPLYNLLDREAEWELIPLCLAEGLGVIPWSPLRAGWLSGRYRRGMTRPIEGGRIATMTESSPDNGEAWANYDNERTWCTLDMVFEIAEETGKTPAQVSVRWLLQRPGVTAPIIGPRTLAHVEDNLGATGWSLTDDQMERLTKASDQRPPYPHDILTQYGRE
jgi:aryl-alcohol dehydrogenase-like predicted oxidoreductase